MRGGVDVSGGGEDELLFASGTQVILGDWSPDGRLIVFASLSRETGFDLWTYSFEDRKAEPWLVAPLDQGYAQVSPNGRWVTYGSYESGSTEVYVQAFPAKGEGRWQVSHGGDQPRWRSDGKEIFYVANDGTVMAADVKTDGAFDAGTPRPLFRAQFKSTNGSNYDVSADGQRFLANALRENDRSGLSTTVVINWTAALKR